MHSARKARSSGGGYRAATRWSTTKVRVCRYLIFTPFGGFGRTPAAWVTVTTLPPTVSVPKRCARLLFFATE